MMIKANHLKGELHCRVCVPIVKMRKREIGHYCTCTLLRGVGWVVDGWEEGQRRKEGKIEEATETVLFPIREWKSS